MTGDISGFQISILPSILRYQRVTGITICVATNAKTQQSSIINMRLVALTILDRKIMQSLLFTDSKVVS